MRCTFFKAHRMVIRHAIFCCAAALLFATVSNSQIAGTGNIQGTVTDTTGAVVAKASVTLTDDSTRVVRRSLSDNAGVFLFPGVPISTYDLSVSAPGFKTDVNNGIVLEVGSSIAINATLSVGATEPRSRFNPRAFRCRPRMPLSNKPSTRKRSPRCR